MNQHERPIYTVRGLRCQNCDWHQGDSNELVPIPKGVTVENQPCPYCGCTALEKRGG